ncbi:MAG: major capsid protein [Candidatus Omnitrophica bacterium]|nr:major capsid protein [Candidatus Omnitrophota bacterium]
MAEIISINLPLSKVAIDYFNQDDNFIATKVLNPIKGDKAGIYYKFGKEAFMLENDLRANGSPSNRIVSFTTGTASYATEKHSLHDVITDDDRRLADKLGIDADKQAIKKLTQKLKLRLEYTVSSTLAGVTQGTTLSGTAQWSNGTGSDPISDIEKAKSTILKNCGMLPNICVMGYEVFVALRQHPDLLDVFKYTRPGYLNEEQLAAAIGVEKVLVGSVVYNTAKEGKTPSSSFMWGKDCYLLYRNNSASAIDDPTAGFIVVYSENGLDVKVKKWRDEDVEGDKIEATIEYAVVLSAPEAIYAIKSAVA